MTAAVSIESVRLDKLEKVIERGLATFVEVGAALLEIRDGKLYRETHKTFEVYCQERWGWQRAHAYRLIDAAEVTDALSPIGDKPKSESVARELSPLLSEPEQVREAWQEAVERHGPTPTAAEVRSVVDARTHNHRAQGTGENEWYTPAAYLDVARAMLGNIDLDPASSDQAQQTVGATDYFTAADDGLSKSWHGRVWLNPPYSQPHIEDFVRKLTAEIDAGTVTEAILLTHNYTDTAWFQHAASASAAICLMRGRIRFLGASGEVASPTQGQAFFYFGPRANLFDRHFAPLGVVLRVEVA